jgi:Cell wall-associated hydrolases (invasion-associated proteins)
MNSFIKFITAGVISLPILFSTTEVHAAGSNNIETPMAGIAVTLDKFYANYEAPRVELRAYSVPDSRTASASVIVSEQLLDTNALLAKVGIEEIAEVITVSPYANVAISRVNEYVNIRSEESTEGEIVGKVYNNAAATIIRTVEGEGGDWYEIKSGSVHGYIKSEFFVTGAEAERIAKEVGEVVATVVGTPTLRLRKEAAASLEEFENDEANRTLTLLSEGSEYAVLEETEDGLFVKIQVDTDLIGYVSSEFVDVNVEFEKAISIEEEEKAKEEAERRKKEAAEAIARAEAAKKEKARQDAARNSANTNRNSTNNTSAPAAVTGGSEVSSATRDAIIAYAKQFLGNPYVYGGTSLTNGADCSGFTSSVYANFGISTGRSSRDQAVRGRDIAIADIRPADLILYASGGTINHVAMYIGNGQVIHASTARTGIIISNAYYRTPYKAVTFLD